MATLPSDPTTAAEAQLLWYFAYGSNMQRATFLERRRMQPIAVRWGWLHDHRLCFDLPVGPGERGVANVVRSIGDRVCGVLYQLTAAEFDRLDLTEGVPAGLYRRLRVDVVDGAGERLDALAYGSTISVPGRRPSARYLGLLLEGARENGLPAEWIELLARLDLAIDERESP
jgi:cation transport regulator ChaC